jgi:ATP-binding cassette subfamily B (MDR/TAP) protein 1
MTKAHAAANHIIHLRRSQPAIGSSKGVSSCLTSEKELSIIQFDNVCFSYPTRPDVPVLRNLNMRIDRGQSIGLVGASGCGKSTIVALLERFYDIESGKLLIEGLPLRDLDIQQHRSRMGLVSQDTTLYQGSIYDNVLLGLEEASFGKRDASLDDLVIRTCKAANIHDFIISLPQGYETSIGSRGISLSGGQRQRLAIARALVRDPEILLLDEATSALDTENEALVQAAIESISQSTSSRTLIAVAHRLSTIKRCDRIFVLHDGQVDEAGTHDALLARRGRYYEMVLAQALDRELDE